MADTAPIDLRTGDAGPSTTAGEAPPVESVEVAVYTVPFDAPESDGTATWDHTTVVVVHVGAGGRRGMGFTYGSAACATIVGDVLAPVVTGRNAFDVPGSWSAMVAAIRNDGRPGICSMAIAAVDTALWDLKARLLDLALVDLFGVVHARVPVYGSGGFTSLSEADLVDQLTGWAAEGIPRVKMKIGTGWGAHERRDVERILAVRDALGPGVALFVDANGAYRATQAAQLARLFEPLGVTWFEEPVSSDDLAGLRDVRASTLLDVAAGEYGYDLVYFERMCAAGAVDVLQADVSRCAGFSEWRRAATVAAAHGLAISGHCAPALHVHVAASVPNLLHVEYFADHVKVDHLLFEGVLEPDEGALVPDRGRPGMGLELKAADAERYRRAVPAGAGAR